jgi:hypothetical protein
MMMSTGETIVAIYDDFERANTVLQALLNEGFLQSDVGLAVSNADGVLHTLDFRLSHFETQNDEENGLSDLLMSLADASCGLTAVDIPGLGSIVTAGPLADLLSDESRPTIGSVTASLVHLGIPSDKADYYADALTHDYALITVHIRTEKAMSIALDILHHNQPVTIKNHTGQWVGFDSPTERIAYDDLAEQHDAPGIGFDSVGRFPYVRLNFR